MLRDFSVIPRESDQGGFLKWRHGEVILTPYYGQ